MKQFRFFSALLAIAFLSGCNNCEKMTEAICKDLGPEDCATWKAIGGPDQAVPGGRKVNRACGTIMDNELAYKGLVKGARGMVLAEQMKKAPDNATRMEIAAKIKALSTSN
jgi:hypothetical protein